MDYFNGARSGNQSWCGLQKVTMAVLIMVAVFVSISTALVGPVTFFGLLVVNCA